MASRTQNAKRNIVTSVVNKLIIMLSNYIMRIVLIRYLGEVYLGLDSLFVSILQILSLSELGMTSAMVYCMYKPLAENDTPTICALLKLYRTVYRWIALAMTALGAAITPFLPIIIKKDLPDGINLYVLFFINLGNTVLSYLMFAYRSMLFTADQKYSTNNNIYSVFKIGATAVQIAAIILFQNYYFYSLVLPLSTIAKNIALYVLSNKMYPQYRCEGVVPKETISDIKKRVSGMFLHKVGAVFQNSLDSIVISAFLGLTVLAKYNSYYYIINAITGTLILISNSVTATAGNSIVTETKAKNFSDFKKLQLLYMWLSSWLTVGFAVCLQPFVKLSFGETMLFPDGIMLIVCFYFFTMQFSRIILLYHQAAGLWWYDRYRPVVAAVVNITLNVLLVRFIGVSGVMFSTIFCILFIECAWAARTLFKYYFTDEKMSIYLYRLLLSMLLTMVSSTICCFLCSKIRLEGIPAICVNGIIATVVSNAVYAAGSSFLPEFKPTIEFALRVSGIKKLFKKRIPK